MDVDVLVRDYLAGLDSAATRLPPARRAELRDEVREHIEAALADAGNRDETTVRNVLERLGPPDEIVAAEAAGVEDGNGVPSSGGAAAVTGSAARMGAVEIIAIILLSVGAILLPIVGPLLGLVFVWLSDRWTAGQKLIATAIVVLLMALPFVLLAGALSAGGVGEPVSNGPVDVPAASYVP
jgi:uncharacterized membrane protein